LLSKNGVFPTDQKCFIFQERFFLCFIIPEKEAGRKKGAKNKVANIRKKEKMRRWRERENSI